MPAPRRSRNRPESVNRLGERTGKHQAAHLTIGYDSESRSLLQGNGLIDRTVLGPLKLWSRELTGVPGCTRLFEIGRTKDRPDGVSTKDGSHRSPPVTVNV